ncbi:MAG: T9SS type A sorting domain-containing protein [Crocinitomicaceae bacterium]|nr:T9SS type A sorting domain-containing protein [Crocinitomicaceae bacterium]
MKKILLSLAVIALGFSAQSQVIVAGIAPANIVGNYDFTWADPAGGDWSTPDFLIPGTFVKDTLVLVEDGTPGTNPQGNPISQEGCSPLTNGTDVNGKIAVIYRNTCEFGTKALNAQNAGAVGVIILNRDPEVIEMGGGADGASVTIPVVMLNSNDGLTLTTEMLNGPVCMFLGNKTGIYDDDAGITKGAALISKNTGVPSQLAFDAASFNFDIGARVYNYGQNDQSNMTLNASIEGPSGNVYDETVTLTPVPSGDSVDTDPSAALNFPQFSLASYPDGIYTLTYTLLLDGVADEYDSDNVITAAFAVQDSVYAFASLDSTGLPTQNNGFRPSTNTSTFSECIVFDNPNGGLLQVDGLYFHALGSNVDLSGEEIALYVYEWQDVFTDLNDAALAFNALNPVGNGYYYYPSDLQGETVYGALNSPVALTDNQRYLFCAQTVNLEVYLGFDNSIGYDWNYGYYAQPLGPIENDGSYFATGFGADIISSVAAKVSNNTVGIETIGTINGSAYPNPANDKVNISLQTTEAGNLVVSDLAGKTVLNSTVSFANGATSVNIDTLEPGVYIFNITLESGITSTFNVVKK